MKTKLDRSQPVGINGDFRSFPCMRVQVFVSARAQKSMGITMSLHLTGAE